MLSRKTLFVVGAGASHELKLPLGTGLADLIAQKLSFRRDEVGRTWAGEGDPALHRIILNKAGPDRLNEYLNACQLIARGIILADSIDRFLDFHRAEPAVQFCGKIALAQTMLEAEKGSSLYVDPGNIYNTLDFRESKDTWLRRLMSLCFGGFERRDASRIFQNVSFITFNYDRCIEQYLFWAVRGLGIPEQEAADIAGKVHIIHPYGSLGRLPWQGPGGAGVPFGAVEQAHLESVASGIRTYTEEVQDRDRLAEMTQLVGDAERIVFLGFAYYDQNMALLKPEKPRSDCRVYGTAYGFSEADQRAIQSTLGLTMALSAEVHASTCVQFFADHQRVLLH